MREATKNCSYCGEMISEDGMQCEQCQRVSEESRWEYGRLRYTTPKRRSLVVAAWICFFASFLPRKHLPLGDAIMLVVLLAGFGMGLILRNSGDATARKHGTLVMGSLVALVVIARIGHHFYMR